MILSVIRTWLYDVIWHPAATESDESKNIAPLQIDTPNTCQTNEMEAGPSPHVQILRAEGQDHNPQTRIGKMECTHIPGRSSNTLPSPISHDPYLGLPVIGNGMTGIIHKLGEDRAVKKAKQYQPGCLQNREDVEYMNQINQQTLDNEIQVFQRLGSHKGIISCFQTSQYGIELALAQENLETYLETYPEHDNSLKTSWIWSIINTFAHVHSCKVYVDDIALRNILVLDGQLKLSDFGQSILLPLDIDVTSANENDVNVLIEILHLGWVLYSIAYWRVHKYYFFSPENPDLCWPEPDSFPNADHVLFGAIIKKCWRGEYTSMDDVRDEAHQLLTGDKNHPVRDLGNES
ncbi:uncharacterized protein BO87DRAFT_402470 [Aspergillus neoniger CBS 115656]|uniref:Protein kinase domain-containing protein n=1 Tax=Aspergillus neoniger (strain CBS 115656) TaxID=1448310 RepID=A0A318Y5S9_ASPNB|nr:hypothetical protein BO87DRAFT_402470 [Aspergillus neoniger CBS 115656]PYH28180.1 hypothetical protein BO87DRAFT_402470 [Aspergillus neoniger CBS 115656]